MKILKTASLLLIGATFVISSAFAQGMGQQQMPDLPTSDDVSAEELDNFIATISDIEPIQVQLQSGVQQLVQENDLSIERFQQLMMAIQNPQAAQQVEMTDKERQQIQNMQPEISDLQMKAQEQMVEKIESNGMNIQRYQAIMMGAQQDQELMTRLQSALQDSTGTEG
jgi:ribosome-binding ATPase YchF (GTP1/OBG family)